MTELKPCPFCGSSDIEINLGYEEAYYQIDCESCDLRAFFFDEKKESIKKWNTRVE